MMNQIEKEINIISGECWFDDIEAIENAMQDYDDQPYGDDNVLVRASKRRSFWAPSSML